MNRSSTGRIVQGKRIAEGRSASVEPGDKPLDQEGHERGLKDSRKAQWKITAFLSAAGRGCRQTLVTRLRSTLRKLRSSVSPTIEHGLSAVGIAIAVASSAFASFMISQEHQAQHEIGAPASGVASNWSHLGRFANSDVDPIATGSIGPAIGTKRGGLSGVGDDALRLESSASKLPGYVLRDVFEGVALVEGRDGIRAVQPGFALPDGYRVTAIERHGGKWVVVTTGGIISDKP